MPIIRPIKILRNITEISQLCQQTDAPIFITKNGYEHLVIMSMDTYYNEIEKREVSKEEER